jgi:RNA polymerase sigma factor (sigma-70 family)
MQREIKLDAQNDATMKSVADEELMLDVRNGDIERLGVLFDRYHVPLFNFYSRLMGDRGLSEDLVQEVFLRILRYRESYHPGTPFRPWIYKIARNASTDHFRKTPRQVRLEPDMAPPVLAEDFAQQRQEAALLRRALLRLPKEKREILILARFQELNYGEIALLLDCQINTVKIRVHRALQDLRKTFHELTRGIAPKISGSASPSISPRRLGNEL